MALNATMIRERCLIQDPSVGKHGSRVLSNRLVLPMGDGHLLVVRGQNMHSVARLAARAYKKILAAHGAWDKLGLPALWASIHADAQMTSLHNWGSVYADGTCLFTSETQHPFLDLIEKQVSNNESNYDLNVMLATETFIAAGHPNMSIDHSTNVALILNVEDDQARMGLIYRHPRRTTTFSFTTSPRKTHSLADDLPAILEAAADFLESIQICYAIATDGAKGIEQDFELQAALKERLSKLRRDIDGFEDGRKLAYRPERPDMNRFLVDAQQLLTRRAR